MSTGPLFSKFTSKEYEEGLDKNLVKLLGTLVQEDIAPFSVLGFPRFFFRDTYLQLCKRHSVEGSKIESFFQSYDRDKELYIAEPIRKVLRNIFARDLGQSDQSKDFQLVLSSFTERANSAEPDERAKYQLEIVFLEYFLRPSWAMSQYVNFYTTTAGQPALLPFLRRIVRAFDDFRRDGLFASESDLALHKAIRSTTDPWRTALSERIPVILSVLDQNSTEYLHLHLSEELLKALIKKRDIDEALKVAIHLEKVALAAKLFDWQALAIRYQARANLLKDDYAASVSTLDRAQRIISSHEPVSKAAEIKVLEISADLFRVTSDFEKAGEAINACIAFYREHEYLSEYAHAVFKKAKILNEQDDGDADSIIAQLRAVEPIFDKMGDPTGRGNARNLHAACLLSKNDFKDEEIEHLLDGAQLDHQRGHSESGVINSLILRAKHEWRRESNTIDNGLEFASEAIQRLEKSGGLDSMGLFAAHEIKAKLLLKDARFDDLEKEIKKLKSLDRMLSNNAGNSQASSATRATRIAELEVRAP